MFQGLCKSQGGHIFSTILNSLNVYFIVLWLSKFHKGFFQCLSIWYLFNSGTPVSKKNGIPPKLVVIGEGWCFFKAIGLEQVERPAIRYTTSCRWSPWFHVASCTGPWRISQDPSGIDTVLGMQNSTFFGNRVSSSRTVRSRTTKMVRQPAKRAAQLIYQKVRDIWPGGNPADIAMRAIGPRALAEYWFLAFFDVDVNHMVF